jgi:signal transduction histidine kinase
MLSDTEIVTILGNLLDNVFDAVADQPSQQRTVRLLLLESETSVLIEVLDRGAGPSASDMDICSRGVTDKPRHHGVGLWLVLEAVTAAMGTTEVCRPKILLGGRLDGFRPRTPSSWPKPTGNRGKARASRLIAPIAQRLQTSTFRSPVTGA